MSSRPRSRSVRDDAAVGSPAAPGRGSRCRRRGTGQSGRPGRRPAWRPTRGTRPGARRPARCSADRGAPAASEVVSAPPGLPGSWPAAAAASTAGGRRERHRRSAGRYPAAAPTAAGHRAPADCPTATGRTRAVHQGADARVRAPVAVSCRPASPWWSTPHPPGLHPVLRQHRPGQRGSTAAEPAAGHEHGDVPQPDQIRLDGARGVHRPVRVDLPGQPGQQVGDQRRITGPAGQPPLLAAVTERHAILGGSFSSSAGSLTLAFGAAGIELVAGLRAVVVSAPADAPMTACS